MIRLLTLFYVCTFFSFQLQSQTYFTTAGIRLGSDFGMSLKQKILKKTTAEMILFSDDNGRSNMGLTMLYDKHKPILTRNFNFFYGTGLSWKWDYQNDIEVPTKSTSLGIPLQAGIEFTIGRINLSWDYTPIFYISTNSNAFTSSKGLSVRYVFITKKEGKRLVKKINPFDNKKKKRKR